MPRRTVAIMAALAAGMPLTASATTNLFTIPSTDLIKRLYLDKVFGALTGAGGTSPIASVVASFNGIVLTMGGVLLTYILITGIFNSAKDGEFMGKSWSAPWLATRMSLGSAAIMPVIGKSFCFLQWAVIWMAMQGIGAADAMWSAYLSSPSLLGNYYMAPDVSNNARVAVQQMLLGNVCIDAENKRLQSMPTAVQQVSFNTNTGYQAVVSSTTGAFQIDYGNVSLPMACGVVGLPTSSVAGAANGATFSWAGNGGNLFNASNVTSFVPILFAKSTTLLTQINTQMAALATTIVAGTATQTQVNTAIASAMQTYTNGMQQAAAAAYQTSIGPAQRALIKAMQSQGMASAGVYYMQIATLQNTVNQAMEFAPMDISPQKALVTPSLQQAMVMVAAYNGSTDTGLAVSARFQNQYKKVTSVGGLVGDIESEIGSSMNKYFYQPVLKFMTGAAGTNPVLQMQSIGGYLVEGAVGGITTTVIVAAGTGFLGNLFTGGLMNVLVGKVISMFSLFLVPGVILEYYIPAIPFLLWIPAIVALMMMILELVAAAPIWGLVHIMPDGEGFIGRAGQGYLSILSLFLTPPLMILGFVASIIIMIPVGAIVNDLMGSFMTQTMYAGHATWNPVPFIITIIIYAFLMQSLVKRVFALSTTVNDKVLAMMGGSAEITQMAQEHQGAVSGQLIGGLAGLRGVQMGMQGVANAGRETKLANSANVAALRTENDSAGGALADANQEASISNTKDVGIARDEAQPRANRAAAFWNASNTSNAVAKAATAKLGSQYKLDRATKASMPSALSEKMAAITNNGQRNGSPEEYAAAFVATPAALDATESSLNQVMAAGTAPGATPGAQNLAKVAGRAKDKLTKAQGQMANADPQIKNEGVVAAANVVLNAATHGWARNVPLLADGIKDTAYAGIIKQAINSKKQANSFENSARDLQSSS